jgi:putative pyruvate formate lyase activating enzyme
MFPLKDGLKAPRRERHRDTRFEAAYLSLQRTGELAARARQALARLASCDLCARYCRVDRTQGTRGAVCRTGRHAVVSSAFPHHGEEDPIRGWRGSGTIFFSWCNLRCVYCQNWELSWKGEGHEVDAATLARMMLELQRAGCHNINFVSPSHVVAQILEALEIAAGDGLRLPLVYNTGGYDSPEALALLDGVIDIYMPDSKYGDSEVARRYSHIRDYVRWNRAALREMHRQVGDLVLTDEGVALRGLLVRHLVLPGGRAGTEEVLSFLAQEISTNTYVNLMDQYRPCFKAVGEAGIDRQLTSEEYRHALALARRYGLERLDHRARPGPMFDRF